MTLILNKRIQEISDSPTLKIAEKASAMGRAGHPVLNLSLGEPDTLVPSWIQEAAKAAIDRGDHLYTPTAGLKELRQAICDAVNGAEFSYTPSNVMVSTGAKQVLFNALSVSLNVHDDVLIPAPYWVSYTAITTLAGGTPVILPCTEENGFKLTAATLQQYITPKTRWLLLNSPNNPSGAVYTKKELADLAVVLEKHPHVWILSDDIYEHLVYDGQESCSILHVAPHLAERTLLVSGFSKSFSMTGWRVGYGLGPSQLIDGMIRLQSQSTSGTCCIAQSAAICALKDPRTSAFLQQQKNLFQKRRDIFLDALSVVPGLNFLKPHGAFYVFVGCQEVLSSHHCTPGGRFFSSDVEFCDALLEEIFISSVPGTEFGMPGYLRLSYSAEESLLREAGIRLQQWMARF